MSWCLSGDKQREEEWKTVLLLLAPRHNTYIPRRRGTAKEMGEGDEEVADMIRYDTLIGCGNWWYWKLHIDIQKTYHEPMGEYQTLLSMDSFLQFHTQFFSFHQFEQEIHPAWQNLQPQVLDS